MQTVELGNVILDIKTILSKNPAPVKRIGLFGSLVKGKFHASSDIDIAIEYEQGDRYDFDSVVKFCEICDIITNEISLRYGRRADVIPVEERKGCLLDNIREEVVWI